MAELVATCKQVWKLLAQNAGDCIDLQPLLRLQEAPEIHPGCLSTTLSRNKKHPPHALSHDNAVVRNTLFRSVSQEVVMPSHGQHTQGAITLQPPQHASETQKLPSSNTTQRDAHNTAQVQHASPHTALQHRIQQ
jgi:hypothetical protein